jgi:integrase
MELLGHSQIAVTMNTYSHVSTDMSREAVTRMQSLLGRSSLVVSDPLAAGLAATPASAEISNEVSHEYQHDD